MWPIQSGSPTLIVETIPGRFLGATRGFNSVEHPGGFQGNRFWAPSCLEVLGKCFASLAAPLTFSTLSAAFASMNFIVCASLRLQIRHSRNEKRKEINAGYLNFIARNSPASAILELLELLELAKPENVRGKPRSRARNASRDQRLFRFVVEFSKLFPLFKCFFRI